MSLIRDESSDNERLSLEGLNFTSIKLEYAHHVFTITLNRPAKRNAISPTMTSELIYALDYAKQQRDVRVVILAANGPVYCAGGDLKAMQSGEIDAASNVPKRGEFDHLALRLHHLNKPCIAKIQGPVLAGGLMFIGHVTHAIAVETATFCAPEILRGLWPFQVMASLFRVMPARAGLDFIMRGYTLGASQAMRLGLINDTVPVDGLDQAVSDLAAELSGLAPDTMRKGLAAYQAQQTMGMEEALPYLRAQLEDCVASEDAKEGIAAFFDKRAPNWR